MKHARRWKLSAAQRAKLKIIEYISLDGLRQGKSADEAWKLLADELRAKHPDHVKLVYTQNP